ncbi:MAG: FAD-binding protein [Bernardetiaceae bacterium]|nr:FAD-binding protein [Bernardetiaceae bacterium]
MPAEVETHFNPISESVAMELKNIVGEGYFISDAILREAYAHDETEDFRFLPEAVVLPENAIQISEIMKLCSSHRIPVTPRGGGTGLAGSALAVHGGLVISTSRLNRILDIDLLNLQATVEPGVVTQVFQEAVKEKGLFYPPDPSSKGTCFLGGNLAQCAGGPKAVKYGVTRDYVLNLEVVLPTGEIIQTGANVLKNSTGYNLTHLMIGSEGTLGIITKIVFKLRPYPKHTVVMLAPFMRSDEAFRAISAIYRAGITPSGMEFMEREAIERTMVYLRDVLQQPAVVDLPENVVSHLIIELDGNDAEVLMRDAEAIVSVLEDFETGELLFAESESEKEALWRLRRNISPAVNAAELTKSEDVVVPRGNLPELIIRIKEIGKSYGFNSVCYGHAGDGNLHINILREQISDEDWHGKVNEGIGEIFKEVVNLGGMLSGEHGIGIAKRPYIEMALGEANLRLMRGIKAVFDPFGVLNPGKIF